MEMKKCKEIALTVNRRNFLLGTAAAAANAGVAAALPNGVSPSGDGQGNARTANTTPNVVIYHSDQFRWDFVGANGLNGSTNTPNLDRLQIREPTLPTW